MGSCGLGWVVIGASPSRTPLHPEVRVMCHVQQKKLTALHLKPKKLRRDIRAVVDSGSTRKTWLDIWYTTKRKGGGLERMDGGKT